MLALLRCSDKGLTLETSDSKTLYGGQFKLSTQLIKPNQSYFLIGLAVFGSVCSSRVTGNVNSYAGLQTAGIIAHEVGHKWANYILINQTNVLTIQEQKKVHYLLFWVLNLNID